MFGTEPGSQAPTEAPTASRVLPPDNLEYTILPDSRFSIGGTEGAFGIFTWKAPEAAETVERFEVMNWLGGEPSTYDISATQTIEDGNAPGTYKNYMLITDLEVGVAYTLKVRAITTAGIRSSFSTKPISAAEDPLPVSLDKVENFRATNGTAGVFTGSQVVMAWDQATETSARGYEIQFMDENSVEVGFVPISNLTTVTHTYSLDNNMGHYLAQTGNVGAYRELIIRIRATNGFNRSDLTNFRSSEWSELI